MPAPNRHHNVLRGINDLYTKRRRHLHTFDNEIQGFLTDTGEFLDRRDAMKHVHECGQGTPRRVSILKENPTAYNGEELFSEDLW